MPASDRHGRAKPRAEAGKVVGRPPGSERGYFQRGYDVRRAGRDHVADGRLGGRPSRQFLRRLQQLEPLALKTLWRIMKSSRRTSDKLAAAKDVLDRLYGRAITPVIADEHREVTERYYVAVFDSEDTKAARAALEPGTDASALPPPGTLTLSSTPVPQEEDDNDG